MTEPKWTAGPWTLGRGSRDTWDCAICAGPHILAHVIGNGYPVGTGWAPESEANARLIAAAPELYQALDAVLGWQDTDPTNFGALIASNHARNILAKARGETP